MVDHNRFVVLTKKRTLVYNRANFKYQYCSSVPSSVADPHHIDVDLDPDPAFYFVANPDPDFTFHSDMDQDPSFQFDADLDPTTHFSPRFGTSNAPR
jgi:hypothetical protein